MELKTYLQNLTISERDDFAEKVGSSRGHLQNVAYKYRSCSEKLAVLIERETADVTRQDLRPDDWQQIWPELAEPAKAVA